MSARETWPSGSKRAINDAKPEVTLIEPRVQRLDWRLIG